MFFVKKNQNYAKCKITPRQRADIFYRNYANYAKLCTEHTTAVSRLGYKVGSWRPALKQTSLCSSSRTSFTRKCQQFCPLTFPLRCRDPATDHTLVRTRSRTVRPTMTLSVLIMWTGLDRPALEPADSAVRPTEQRRHHVRTSYRTALATTASACVERTAPGPWRTAENLAATVVLAHRLVASSTSVPTRASSTARETSGMTVVPTSVNVLTPAQAGTNVTTNVPATTTSQMNADWYRFTGSAVWSLTVTLQTLTLQKTCQSRVPSTVVSTRRARCGLWAASLSVSVWTLPMTSTAARANVLGMDYYLATVN